MMFSIDYNNMGDVCVYVIKPTSPKQAYIQTFLMFMVYGCDGSTSLFVLLYFHL